MISLFCGSPSALFCMALENSEYCPPGYHMSGHEGVNKSSRICRFCPHVSCFITKGLDNAHVPTRVMSCARLHDLPQAKDVLVYLPCVLIGDGSRNIFDLFIYHPKSYDETHDATCIGRTFLKWLNDENIKLRSLELGFSTHELAHPSILAEYKKPFAEMEHLCIQSDVDLTKESLTRWEGTLKKLKIILKHKLDPSVRPLTKGKRKCKIRAKYILHLEQTCYLTTYDRGFPKITPSKHSVDHAAEKCDYARPSKSNLKEMDADLSAEMETYILLSVILGLVIVIGSFILIYYIRNHSRFSAHQRQARLEKKRAIDMYMKQNYMQNTKLSNQPTP